MARPKSARAVALGGVFAALSIVIQCLGGLIPVATFVCPMLCILLLAVVLRICGRRMAWAWYGAVAFLSLLLSPDKEAAAVFVFLGYYPIVKPKFDRLPFRWLWKGLLFVVSVSVMYWMLIHLLGMTALAEEFKELGIVMTAVTWILGATVFFLLDRLLQMRFGYRNQ